MRRIRTHICTCANTLRVERKLTKMGGEKAA